MMHTICKYTDDTELVISDLIKRNNGEEVIKVIYEIASEGGLESA